MRTHLLRTFYPSPAAEPDTGIAANDDRYEKPEAAGRGARPMALVAATTLQHRSEEDDYVLGGYAGI